MDQPNRLGGGARGAYFGSRGWSGAPNFVSPGERASDVDFFVLKSTAEGPADP